MFQVMRSLCETCIFRPGTPIPDARDRVVREAVEGDSFVVCHSTLHVVTGYGGDDEDEEWESDVSRDQAVCRGFWDRYGGGNLGRIAERLEMVDLNWSPPERGETDGE